MFVKEVVKEQKLMTNETVKIRVSVEAASCINAVVLSEHGSL